MPLTATALPAEIDALGVRWTMQHHAGHVRCHVLRSTLDQLGEGQARGDGDALLRFAKNRPQFEAVASDLYDGGHLTPWIAVTHLMSNVPPHDGDDERW